MSSVEVNVPQILTILPSSNGGLLNNIVFVEYIPRERIRAVMETDMVKTGTFEPNSFNELQAKTIGKYQSPAEQMEKYLKRYDPRVSGVAVKYRKAKHLLGRVYPIDAMGFTSIKRSVRNSMIDGLYNDYDMENAQFSILAIDCQKAGIKCDSVLAYNANRDQYMGDLIERFGVRRKDAKRLMLSICFGQQVGQGWTNWLRRHKLDLNAIAPIWVTALVAELPSIIEEIKKQNPQLYSTADKKNVGRARENKLGTFFSLYLQEREYRIVEYCIDKLIKDTTLMNHPIIGCHREKVGSYEFDGVKLLTENVDKWELEHPDGSSIASMLNGYSAEMGYPVRWVGKELDDVVDLTAYLDQIADELTPDEAMKAVLLELDDCKNDAGICRYIEKYFPGRFIFHTKELVWYCWTGRKWDNTDQELRMTIINKLHPHIQERLAPYLEKYPEEDKNDPNSKMLYSTLRVIEREVQFKSQNYAGMNGIVGTAKTIFGKDVAFNTNDMLLGFTNGCYDFNEEMFRPYRYDDYMTMNCGYEFNKFAGLTIKQDDGTIIHYNSDDWTEEDKLNLTELGGIYSKIFPDNEIQQFFFSVVSTGLVGKCIEHLIIFNGSGRNGKGFHNEFMAESLGDYFASVSPIVLSEDPKNKSSAGPNPELRKLHNARYVVFKEPSASCPIDNEVYKDMTGGGLLSARNLHSNDTKVRLCMTAFIECNKRPPLKNNPTDADAKRIIDLLFGSSFVDGSEDYPVDEPNHKYMNNPSLKNKDFQHKMRPYIMNLLIGHCLSMKKQNWIFEKPNSVAERSRMYLLGSMDIFRVFQEYFEPRRDDVNYTSKEDMDVKFMDVWKAVSSKAKMAQGAERKALKDYKKEDVFKFLQTEKFFKSKVYEDSSNHTFRVRGYRRIPEELEEEC